MSNVPPEEPRPPAIAPPVRAPVPQGSALAAARFEQLLRLGARACGPRSARSEAEPRADERSAEPESPASGTTAGESAPQAPPGDGPAPRHALRQQHGGGREGSREPSAHEAAGADSRSSRVSATGAVDQVSPAQEPVFDVDGLAARVEHMFRSATGGMDSWKVTLDLHQDLPETVLRICASRSRVDLRFSTQSADSARLLSQHMPSLEQRLADALDMPHQIDVSLE